MDGFEAAIAKTDVFFWENLEEIMSEIWNEIDTEVVRNLYEKYTNRLKDIKKLKMYWRVIREQNWNLNVNYLCLFCFLKNLHRTVVL